MLGLGLGLGIALSPGLKLDIRLVYGFTAKQLSPEHMSYNHNIITLKNIIYNINQT